jgi:hypothetical protein
MIAFVVVIALGVFGFERCTADPLKGTEAKGRWRVETFADFASQFGHGPNYYDRLFLDGKRVESEHQLQDCILEDSFAPRAAVCCRWEGEKEGSRIVVFVINREKGKPSERSLGITHTRFDGLGLCQMSKQWSSGDDSPHWSQGRFIFGRAGAGEGRWAFDPATGGVTRSDG